jgi:hypothetical protein
MSGTRQKLVMKMPNETPTTLEPQYARYDDIHSQTMIQYFYLYPAVTYRRYRDLRRRRAHNRIEESLDHYARPHLRSERSRGPASDGTGLLHARFASLLPLEKVSSARKTMRGCSWLMPLQLGVRSARPRIHGRATCGIRLHLDRSQRTARRARARSASRRRSRERSTSTVPLLSARPRRRSWRENLAHASSRCRSAARCARRSRLAILCDAEILGRARDEING